jgi:integrase
MNHTIRPVVLPSGEERFELRVFWEGYRAKQIKRRFKTKRDATNYLYELLQKEDSPREEVKFAPQDTVLFGELYQHWYTTRASVDFAPGWLRSIDSYWVSLRGELNEKRVSEVKPELLKDIELKLRAHGNSRKTVRNKIGFILSVMNYAVQLGKLKENPCAGYKLPTFSAQEIEFWEMNVAKDFLSSMSERYPLRSEKRWVYAAYLTAINTGLRAGELWALKPSNLKFDQGLIKVTHQCDRVSGELTLPKSKKSREVPLNDAVATELRFLINDRRLAMQDYLFTSSEHPTCHDNFADRVFSKDIDFWRGPKITFHGLRHTAATLMLRSGVDVKTVKEVLGHQDIKTTMRYTHGNSVASVNEKFSVSAPKEALIMKVVK